MQGKRSRKRTPFHGTKCILKHMPSSHNHRTPLRLYTAWQWPYDIINAGNLGCWLISANETKVVDYIYLSCTHVYASWNLYVSIHGAAWKPHRSNQDDYMYTEKYPDPNARDCGPFTIMGQRTQMVVSSNKAMIVCFSSWSWFSVQYKHHTLTI